MTDWQGIWILAAYGFGMGLLGSYIGAAMERRRILRALRKALGTDEGKGGMK